MQTPFTVIVAARMGSSRFPGKTLADLYGKPMLQMQVERIKHARFVEKVVLATTDSVEDDILEAWCDKNSVNCFRGSCNDVLERIHGAAHFFEATSIIEILGDNPLVHSSMIDACAELFLSKRVDYAATVTNEYPLAGNALARFPIGVRVQVMSLGALDRVNELAIEPRHREHATSFIAENPDLFSIAYLEASGVFATCHCPEMFFAVNTPQQLNEIRRIFTTLYPNNQNFSVGDAIACNG